MIFFSLLNICFFIYIINRLYYIFKKNTNFFSLSTDISRENIIKQIFTSVIQRHILYICYFIICLLPSNICLIIKEVFDYDKFSNYFLEFITLTLISLYSTFILLVKLTDPIIKSFLCNINNKSK